MKIFKRFARTFLPLAVMYGTGALEAWPVTAGLAPLFVAGGKWSREKVWSEQKRGNDGNKFLRFFGTFF